MKPILLLLTMVLLAVCQAQPGARADDTVSADFFHDPRMDNALKDITRAARGRCNSPAADTLDPCVIDRVIPALPYADKMVPFCKALLETIDRYFCIMFGALGADLVEKSGTGSAEEFLKEHGTKAERVINEAGAKVIAYLSGKCSNDPACGSREAAGRFGSSSHDIAACARLGPDWGAVTCLLTSRAVSQLRLAESRL
jgi:hypothetical protein